MKTTKAQRKATHRELTRLGVPRSKDGNKLGLERRRRMLGPGGFGVIADSNRSR